MCLTETWLNSNNVNIFGIEGYTVGSAFCRTKLQGGGCMILIKRQIKHKQRNDISNLSLEQQFEICCIELNEAIIMVVYRSPSADLSVFMANIEKCLDKVTNNNNKTVILCGDFNIDFALVHDNSRKVLGDLLDSFILKQQVFDYTRVTSNCKSCIDNIFTDSCETKNVRVLNGVKSDHLAQIVDIKLNVEIVNTKRKVRKINHNSLNNLKASLLSDLDDPNKYVNFKMYFDRLLCKMDEYLPVVELGNRNYKNFNEWATKGILISRKTLFSLYAISNVTKSPVDKNKASRYSKLFKAVCLTAKIIYFTRRIESASNKIKCIWQIIKEETGKKTNNGDENSSCDKILTNKNEVLTDKNDICNYFYIFFVNVAQEL